MDSRQISQYVKNYSSERCLMCGRKGMLYDGCTQWLHFILQYYNRFMDQIFANDPWRRFHTDVTYLFVPGATRFKPNTRYTYRYVATSVTGVNGTTNQTTGLRLEAKCEIEGVGECQNLLRVCALFWLYSSIFSLDIAYTLVLVLFAVIEE